MSVCGCILSGFVLMLHTDTANIQCVFEIQLSVLHKVIRYGGLRNLAQ